MDRMFNILIVDDDLNSIQVGINFLKKNAAYHLVFATSGQEALERLKEDEYDLVLLDILMPVMDGFEVCRRIKNDARTRDIPVIFLTAKTESDDVLTGFELGGSDYITKPFNAPELNARVKTHLDLHHYYQTEIKRLNNLLISTQQLDNIRFQAGGVAHDCRNYLATIPLNINMMEKIYQENTVPSDSYISYSSGVRTAVESIATLLAQLSAHSAQTEKASTILDLNEVVDTINQITASSIPHSITCEARVLHEPVRVLAERVHIEQVLLNFIINSQKAIEERQQHESIDGVIILSVNKTDTPPVKDSQEEFLTITVEDNGYGMSAEIIDSIFDPYFTTRDSSGGTGLGLAVSKQIVESYGGCITVESLPGSGSTFILYLPEYKEEN